MLLAILAVVIAAPFERALIAIPGAFTVTTVEAVVAVALVVVTIRLGPRALLTQGSPLLLPGGVFLLALALAAAVTSFEQGNAARFAVRMAVAAWLCLATSRVIDTPHRARLVVRTLVATAAVVAFVAVLEVVQVGGVMTALTAFRPGFHVVAGQLRATSTLFYPTIASMYLEVAFAFGLWLLLVPATRWPRVERALAFVALVVIGAGISATFTRAGLLAMAAAIVLMAALRLARLPRHQAQLGTLTALASTLIVVVVVTHSPELLATRLTTEGSAAWYGVRYEVPAGVALDTGRVHRVPVTLTNTGRLPWDSHSAPGFALSYHWLRRDSGEVVEFDGERTAFPHVVRPGATVSLDAVIRPPAVPGAYILVWDVVHETRAWLSTEGVATAETRVDVSGAPTGIVETQMVQLPQATLRPSRPRLWAAALTIAGEHPLTGIGPDNYRLAYGPYLGLDRWDTRVHANNMYLEILTGAGVPGFGALVWLIGASGVHLWRRERQAPHAMHAAACAALAAWLIVAGHGFVDSFLAFTTTYVVFAVAAGIGCCRGLAGPVVVNAHRV